MVDTVTISVEEYNKLRDNYLFNNTNDEETVRISVIHSFNEFRTISHQTNYIMKKGDFIDEIKKATIEMNRSKIKLQNMIDKKIQRIEKVPKWIRKIFKAI